MFEELDKLMNSIKEKEEMDDFLNKNIYPERLQSSSKLKCVSPIKETIFPVIVLEDISNYCLNIKNKIDSINDLIISSNNLQLFDDIETCPICTNELNTKNIMIPICGHKTCIHCFVDNLHLNKNTGNLCSLCRTIII
jgi:hypothetical protein